MLTKKYNQQSNNVAVTFIIPVTQLPQYFEVKSAAVVADFNQWSIVANPMTFVAGVGYTTTVELAPSKTYEYRYVLNDVEWYNDWAADGYEPNRLQNADNCVCNLMGIGAEAPVEKDPNAEDKLTKIEGIGPKISGLLKADGIRTFEALSNASVERIQGILNAAGRRYQMAVPTTWPKQAGLAAAGKWDELEAYQDILDGGKPPA